MSLDQSARPDDTPTLDFDLGPSRTLPDSNT